MKNSLLLICMLLVCGVCIAQKKITINGYISDSASGERLQGATVTIPKLNIGASSNTYGFYSLTIPSAEDSVDLLITYVGYSPFVQRIVANDNYKLDVKLLQAQQLGEVVITASRKPRFESQTQMSSVNLSPNFIKSLPAFLGEADILKALQFLPGIQAGSEGSNGIYVRGGSVDQNLILLDGVPVYNASHLFGFFSVFNADAIHSVDVYKGGFPARYGGRLSSVIDIRMKEGNNQKFHGEGGIGLITSRLTLEGPIKKGKSSFMVSGRRTYMDLLLRPILKSRSNRSSAGYFFYDLNAKLNFTLGKKDHLYLSGYFGKDKFFNSFVSDYVNSGNVAQVGKKTTEVGFDWGNATAVARWNHEFNRKLFSNVTASYSRFDFRLPSREVVSIPGVADEITLQEYSSGIEDFSLKIDFDYVPGPNHTIKTGASVIWHTYTPGAYRAQYNTVSQNENATLQKSLLTSQEYDLYVEDDIKISRKLKANAGLHLAGFVIRNKTYSSLQPRLSARYLIRNNMSIKASYAQMNQFIHLLSNSGLGFPTDLWVPATNIIPPQVSRQFAVGWAYTHRSNYEISVEAYHKTMNNVIEYSEGAVLTSVVDDWESRVEVGDGVSYGAEFFVQKKKGKTTGLIGYTLSWTNRQFANLNFGRTFPYKYDRRHDFKIALVHSFSKRFQISADWVYGTGIATTLPVATISDINRSEVEIFTGRNNYRLPAFHRMDVGMKWTKQKKKYERAWVLSIYNVYSRLNTFYVYRLETVNSFTGLNETKFIQGSLFPIIPSVSYQFKF